MKKLYLLLFLIPFLLIACKKDELTINKLEIVSEETTNIGTAVTITVEYTYVTSLKSVVGYISKNSDMSNATSVDAFVSQTSFVIRFTNLDVESTYYYYYECDNGVDVIKTDVKSILPDSYNLPTVITAEVSNVTSTTATTGGNVTKIGGSNVTARGVCWGTTTNPTLNDSCTIDGTGAGEFTSRLTGLTPNTTYYVRAYATNTKGTAYGTQKTFTTSNVSVPVVTTNEVTSITKNSAICGGTVSADGGVTVIARGVCWSAIPHPTANDSHTTNGNGTGSFISNITGLTPSTLYYVRAYAKSSNMTYYGEEKSFTTEEPYIVPTGAINGLFSVSQSKKVLFSKGDLQYQASTATWRFAENQWDYIGNNNSNISSSYSGWIDLFGWGTSGYNHGAVCYQPWSTSKKNSDYYAYGNSTNNLSSQSGKADWGYNAISNGGNIEHTWRTLTYDEWCYVFFTRQTTSGDRFAKAVVNDVNGVILLPDNWTSTNYNLNETNSSGASFNSNIISQSDWVNQLEANGAVFLPAAGGREGTTPLDIGTYGHYWTATSNANDGAEFLCFYNGGLYITSGSMHRYDGEAVRLVYDID